MLANKNEERRGKGRPRGFDRGTALNAALRLFWRKGYEPTSVSELCDVMEIRPPSLYATFGNKAALFLEAVRHYEKTYWEEPATRFMEEEDIYKALGDYFGEAAEILLSPATPCGCMVVLAAVNISEDEQKIISAIRDMRVATKKMFAERLRKAIMDGQIPADTDVPALAGALNTLLEGLSLQARDGLFLSELKAIASHAVKLLPPPREASIQNG
ncbi:MAG: TetR/AcrR family transcriptional regulator [Desulfovibrio sp.]